ncbi:endolytic transglycosylase MltG [Cytobacillus sp. S13-E01]|uniref:endolytic transglycosylase MltG n=1 Tax=Cytobacillus sp. S13-E01 TaxID=3031326 RepID=UPI0023D8BE1E|nr:endolytic transglycosylase MltG [Cytobacillus sp. S13-E01]MDF0728587.1 endolytic transglycosylase MltG [Cytobacillus sp. S13-E01]
MSEVDSNDKEYKEKLLERQSEARVVRRIVLIIFIIILLSISGVVGGGYLYIKSALQPVDPKNNTQIEVTIPIGSSPTTIANILEENGIVKDAKVFRYYTKFRNESGFQAGDYKLTPAMTFQEIVSSLKTGKVMEEVKFSLTIPEGKQLQQIAKIIAEKTNQNEDEVFTKLNDKKFIEELMTLYPSVLTNDILHEDIMYPLEGYLFPATYPIYKEKPTIEDIVQTMLNKTEEILIKFQGAAEEKEMSVHTLLTMASLIEEEATAKTDRQKIASVFYNRLDIGMPLQTDPTVLYAIGAHQERVLYEDLEVDSPFNTYKINGLPPGPIANAGEMSIEAALNPAETDFLYFLATSSGEVIFTKTLNDHNRAKAKYIGN